MSLTDAFVADPAAFAIDVLATVLLTAVGIEAELLSLHSAGDTTLALWAGYMGLIALYAGLVVVGGGRLLPRLRAGDTA